MTIHHIHQLAAPAGRVVGLALVMCGALAFTPSASAELHRGQKSFGPRVGFVSRNTSVAAGLEFSVATAEHVRLSPEVSIVFRHKNRDGLGIGFNVDFPFEVAPRFVVYPLVGAQYMSWGLHDEDPETAKDVTTHANRFGGNAGAGIEYYCTPSLKLNLEGRYTLLSAYSTAVVNLGISFVF